MGSGKRHLYLVAGEPSGDTHAAHVLEEIRALAPDLGLRGLGGPLMRRAGMSLQEDLASEAVMGLFPVLKALPWIRRLFNMALDDLRRDPPAALVLVDYPGFNMRLAARARKLGIPVIYYISPQVWAWASWRIKKLARLVDLMLVILPFEEKVYHGTGLKTVFTGHPLMERLKRSPPDGEVVRKMIESGSSPLVGLFPGSRRHVVEALLPVFVECAQLLRELTGTENAHFLLALAQENHRKLAMSLLDPELPVDVHVGRSLEVMEACDVCLTSSGTTTLELAGIGTPFVLGYRVSPILYLLGRWLISVPHIGLVNLVAGHSLVPEHVGVRSFAASAANDLNKLWTVPAARERQLDGLAGVRRKLGSQDSYLRAAEEIVQFVEQLDPHVSPGDARDSRQSSR